MSIEINEPVFLSTEDEQKYRELKSSYHDAIMRLHELRKFINKLKEISYSPLELVTDKPLNLFANTETVTVTKKDYDKFIEWKKLINGFDI